MSLKKIYKRKKTTKEREEWLNLIIKCKCTSGIPGTITPSIPPVHDKLC